MDGLHTRKNNGPCNQPEFLHLRCKKVFGLGFPGQTFPFRLGQETIELGGAVDDDLVVQKGDALLGGTRLCLKGRREAQHRQEKGDNQLHFARDRLLAII